MFIIVGLGNPGKKYENTRHNVGFDAVDLLVDEYRIPSAGTQHKAMYGKGIIGGQKVILAKPLTYLDSLKILRAKMGNNTFNSIMSPGASLFPYTNLTWSQTDRAGRGGSCHE